MNKQQQSMSFHHKFLEAAYKAIAKWREDNATPAPAGCRLAHGLQIHEIEASPNTIAKLRTAYTNNLCMKLIENPEFTDRQMAFGIIPDPTNVP